MSLVPGCVSGGACCLHSTILVASATCWNIVARLRYIYGLGREWPWTLGSSLREVRAGNLGAKALILRRNRPMKRTFVGTRQGTIRRGGLRRRLSLEGGRGRLEERMLEQRTEAMAVTWAERGATEPGSVMGGTSIGTLMGKGGRPLSLCAVGALAVQGWMADGAGVDNVSGACYVPRHSENGISNRKE